jgi:putative addiction module component (TIGR02574 family)
MMNDGYRQASTHPARFVVEYPVTKESVMGQALHALGIDSMSFEDRIALVKDIWDSVAIEAGLLPPSPAEMAELDRRLAEDDATPDDTIAWETIKAEAQERWQR